MDREKVIQGLEECAGTGKCQDCVYGKEHPALSCKALLEDALALLKEQEATQKDGYNLQELWKRARAGETLSETELNFLLADWDERNIFKQADLEI